MHNAEEESYIHGNKNDIYTITWEEKPRIHVKEPHKSDQKELHIK